MNKKQIEWDIFYTIDSVDYLNAVAQLDSADVLERMQTEMIKQWKGVYHFFSNNIKFYFFIYLFINNMNTIIMY